MRERMSDVSKVRTPPLSGPAMFSAPPCSLIRFWLKLHSPLNLSRARRAPACGYVDNARALPTYPQAQQAAVSVNLIALERQGSDPACHAPAPVSPGGRDTSPGSCTIFARIPAAVHSRRSKHSPGRLANGCAPKVAAIAATISAHSPNASKWTRKKFASWDRKACSCARSLPLQARKRRVLALPVLYRSGAPQEIRTPDPQIRSLLGPDVASMTVNVDTYM